MALKDWTKKITDFWKSPRQDVSAERETLSKNILILRESLGEGTGQTELSNLRNQEDAHEIDPFHAANGFDDWEQDRRAELQERIDAWSGASVHELEDLNLMEISYSSEHLLHSERLLQTVPDNYRGEVREADRESTDAFQAMTNSMAGSSSSATILAIDQAGEALVREYVADLYTDAEGWSFTTMPKEQAFTLVDNYRSSHEIVNQFISGQLPARFNYLESESELRMLIVAQYLPDEFQEVKPESGQTYRGNILHRTDVWVAQDIGDGQCVVHDAKCLVGATPSVGEDFEIHYPQGQVGLVREANYSHEIEMQCHQKSNRELSF